MNDKKLEILELKLLLPTEKSREFLNANFPRSNFQKSR